MKILNNYKLRISLGPLDIGPSKILISGLRMGPPFFLFGPKMELFPKQRKKRTKNILYKKNMKNICQIEKSSLFERGPGEKTIPIPNTKQPLKIKDWIFSNFLLTTSQESNLLSQPFRKAQISL